MSNTIFNFLGRHKTRKKNISRHYNDDYYTYWNKRAKKFNQKKNKFILDESKNSRLCNKKKRKNEINKENY